MVVGGRFRGAAGAVVMEAVGVAAAALEPVTAGLVVGFAVVVWVAAVAVSAVLVPCLASVQSLLCVRKWLHDSI